MRYWAQRALASRKWLPRDLGLWGGIAQIRELRSPRALVWADTSGSGHNLSQGSGTSQPTLITNANRGMPALRFGGTKFMSTGAIALNQPCTVFLVYKSITIGAASAADFVFDGNSVATMAYLSDTTPSSYIHAGASLTYSGNIANGEYVLLTAVFNGASSKIIETTTSSRTTRGSGDAGANNAGGFTLGSVPGGGRYSNIEVCELGILARAVTAGEQDLYDTYVRRINTLAA